MKGGDFYLDLTKIKIGFVLTGSFCTFQKTIPKIEEIVNKGAEVIPIMSFNAYNLDTKFGKAKDFIDKIEEITGREIIHTIKDAEPIGPKKMTDIMVVAPATGNTMAKLANDIVDTPALMAIKSHLRNENPLVIAPSTNNGLSANAENIGKLLNKQNYYFVPFRQDNPITKPRSLVFDPEYIIKTIESALNREQIQPILL
jgi:dipicolinate synthase subunit B